MTDEEINALARSMNMREYGKYLVSAEIEHGTGGRFLGAVKRWIENHSEVRIPAMSSKALRELIEALRALV